MPARSSVAVMVQSGQSPAMRRMVTPVAESKAEEREVHFFDVQ